MLCGKPGGADAAEFERLSRASHGNSRGTAAVSLQVMQEFFVVATRKLRVVPELAQRKVEVRQSLALRREGCRRRH
jgi:hypothetical protein